MNIDNLIVEITRNCNLQCEHCLRGCAQNIDITHDIMNKFIIDNNIEYISSVTFTGGEPTLNYEAINQFVDICKNNNVEVGSFYIAINGVNVPDGFIMSVVNLYALCSDNEISAIHVSDSDFHVDQDDEQIEKLKILSIFSRKEHLNESQLINEGNATKWISENVDGNGRIIDIDSYNDELLTDWNDEDYYSIPGEIYLNVHGDIVSCCDLSYESQDEYKLGNIHNNTLTEMINKLYNDTGD